MVASHPGLMAEGGVRRLRLAGLTFGDKRKCATDNCKSAPRAVTVSLLALALMLTASPGRAQSPTPATTATDLSTHVRAGDRARAEGRLTDAAFAYLTALKLKDDPSVAGRLGLVMLKLGETRLAANTLVRAIEDQASLTAGERAQVTKAFEAARREVCRLTVRTNENGAELLIDGKVADDSATTTAVLFIDPGEHDITVRLKGYHDATTHIKAEKGGVADVTLELRPVDPPSPPPAPASPYPPPSTLQPAPEGAPKPSAPERPKAEEASLFRPRSVVIGVGASALWGLAPAPVLGPSLAASVRWGILSVGADARAAWSLPIGQVGTELRGTYYAGTVQGCGHWQWAFGCALVQVNAVAYSIVSERRDVNAGTVVLPALGAAAGVELPQGSRFRVRLKGELTRGLRRPTVQVEGRSAWSSMGFFGGAGVEAVAAF